MDSEKTLKHIVSNIVDEQTINDELTEIYEKWRLSYFEWLKEFNDLYD